MPRQLELQEKSALDNYEVECGGCRRQIKPDEKRLGCIESCCGGCYRNLCMECCRWIAEQIAEKKCLLCSRVLGNPEDPLSEDCGGNCLGCTKEIEKS